MIKKNTKVVFKDGINEKTEDMVGGIPLSKGEIVRIHEAESVREYIVTEKIIDCYLNGEDQTVDITYIVQINK